MEKTIAYIKETLGKEELLVQLSEEAGELGKAALKMRRTMSKRNPTPIAFEDAEKNLIEEIADVLFCLSLIGYAPESLEKELREIREYKTIRWAGRLGYSPKKTRLTDFLEKYPNAELTKNGLPSIAPRSLGYCLDSCLTCPYGAKKIADCWNLEVDV